MTEDKKLSLGDDTEHHPQTSPSASTSHSADIQQPDEGVSPMDGQKGQPPSLPPRKPKGTARREGDMAAASSSTSPRSSISAEDKAALLNAGHTQSKALQKAALGMGQQSTSPLPVSPDPPTYEEAIASSGRRQPSNLHAYYSCHQRSPEEKSKRLHDAYCVLFIAFANMPLSWGMFSLSVAAFSASVATMIMPPLGLTLLYFTALMSRAFGRFFLHTLSLVTGKPVAAAFPTVAPKVPDSGTLSWSNYKLVFQDKYTWGALVYFLIFGSAMSLASFVVFWVVGGLLLVVTWCFGAPLIVMGCRAALELELKLVEWLTVESEAKRYTARCHRGAQNDPAYHA